MQIRQKNTNSRFFYTYILCGRIKFFLKLLLGRAHIAALNLPHIILSLRDWSKTKHIVFFSFDCTEFGEEVLIGLDFLAFVLPHRLLGIHHKPRQLNEERSSGVLRVNYATSIKTSNTTSMTTKLNIKFRPLLFIFVYVFTYLFSKMPSSH